MANETDNLVNDLLNILQPEKAVEKPIKKEKVAKKDNPQMESKQSGKNASPQKNIKAESEGFLSEIDETVKNTLTAKVVIRKDLYEVFMLIKRAKQVKSVTTLLDLALEDYIKRNSENIKKLLSENQSRTIF